MIHGKIKVTITYLKLSNAGSGARGLKWLEPYDAKVSRTVPRRGV